MEDEENFSDDEKDFAITVTPCIPSQQRDHFSTVAPHFFLRSKIYVDVESNQPFVKLLFLTNKSPSNTTVPHINDYDAKNHFYSSVTISCQYFFFLIRAFKKILQQQKKMGVSDIFLYGGSQDFGPVKYLSSGPLITITPEKPRPGHVERICVNKPLMEKIMTEVYGDVKRFKLVLPMEIQNQLKNTVQETTS